MKKTTDVKQNDIERFSPTPESGLSPVQVESRLSAGLTNSVAKKYSKSYLSIFVGNICTFFNLLGLIVCIALITVKAGLFDFVFVLVYLMNIGIGIVQEIRAKRCIDRLSLTSCKNSVVIRDGVETDVSPDEIVLDEVIKLSIGNQVPVDSRILQGDTEVDESFITGESVPVKKGEGDSLFAGSFIVSGNCTVIAEKVGSENYVQKLSAQAKKYKKPHSELMESLKLLIKILGFIIIPIAAAYMLKTTLIFQTSYSDLITSTAPLVIGMIPSGMFLLTSLALAVGIIKLAAHNTLVQDLYSLEMLARVDTICFDKTGTITDGKMKVQSTVSLNGISKDGISSVLSTMLGALQDKNQTAEALSAHFGQEILFEVTDKIPFNSERKFSAVTFSDKITYVLGAPEFVLKKETYQSVEPKVFEYVSKGLRVLMLAESDGKITDNIRDTLSPAALILLTDNIRPDAVSTVKWFKENGVTVKVISGDNPVTVSEVSKRVGIENADKYISLEGLSDEDVKNAATEYTVFGRVSPEQKAILVKSIKSAGHMTAMTGDGVNDVLALKEADCAVTVASGSDAARSIAHIVLLDNNFNSMPNVVYEGRRVINNVQSSASLYLMKTFFTMLIACLAIILPFVEKYPFQLKQMNLLEILIIGIPSFFLSLQPNDSLVKGKFLNYVIKKSVPGALLMVLNVAVIFIFKYALKFFPDTVYQTLSVFALTFAGLINLLFICRPLNKYRSILITFCSVSLIAIFIYVVFTGFPAFGFVKLSPLAEYWHHLLILIAMIILDIPLSVGLQKLFEKLLKKKMK